MRPLPHLRPTAVAVAAALALTGLSTLPQSQAVAATTPQLTVATFNASLNRNADGQLKLDLATPDNQQARNAAETIQRSGADIVLVNEFDHDADGTSAKLFRDNYLKVSQNSAPAADYPYYWAGPVNTGVPSGMDLNNDGTVGGADDAFGFGTFPGQYGMVVYSKYPINTADVRTFQNFLWKDMPGAKLPDDPATPQPADWYSTDELQAFRLSSKTHADVPVDVDGTIVHVLAAHPTPPSFDGPEKRNKLRNHDEIRLFADYISGKGGYLYDDKGVRGGLAAGANFVIVGDYNSDPFDGDSEPGSIQQLLDNPALQDTLPTSAGAVEAAGLQGGANVGQTGDPKYDTADFNDTPRPGNIRVDYVLPNAGATVTAAGVFWPVAADPLSRLTGVYPFPTSDHRLVWIKASFPAAEPQPQPTNELPTAGPSATPSGPPSSTPANPARPPKLPNTGA
ncbi:endonuclease/exonuclease/phosphatase family protein [Propionibacteriaceae bacterium G1746]